MRKIYIIKATKVLSFILLCFLFINSGTTNSSISSDEALKLLKDGNARFISGLRTYPDQNAERLKETAGGQHPFATIVACSDSRVPPEMFFDRGIGDLFIIRVAGNVSDVDEIGSIEYGVEHLGTPLLVIAGHTRCGAVTAVMKGDEVGGSIPQLVDNIIPAAEKIKKKNSLVDDDMIYEAVIENVWQSIADTITGSQAVRELIERKKLEVIGAVYHIEDGSVQWLGTHPQEEFLLKTPKETIAVSEFKIVIVLGNLIGLFFVFVLFYFVFIGKRSVIKNLNIKNRMMISAFFLPVLTVISILINFMITDQKDFLNMTIGIGLPLLITLLFSFVYFRTLLNLFSEYVRYLKNSVKT